jgi:hypothetical protein
MYPYFATFAAFYGQPTDSRRYLALQKLADGASLPSLLCMNDRAFLFMVYVNLCANLEHDAGTAAGSWYFSPNATVTLKIIKRWMVLEDKDKDEQKAAAKAVSKHLEPIVCLLPGVEEDEAPRSDDDDGSGTDSEG